jgi:1,4-dihydroxy-2-naphthoate octaprenyltransferase
MKVNKTTVELVPGTVWAFIRLGRFQFLIGGVVLYGLGLAMAIYRGVTVNWVMALWGQLIVTCTQLMVHYGNDYYDLEADRANPTPTRWSGGSRVLLDGRIAPRLAGATALILAGAAVILSCLLALVMRPGPLALPALLLAIALAWAYSGPPFRMHSRSLGELSGVFVLAILTPVLGFYLQTGKLDAQALLALVPLCFLQFAMILSVELPDADGDAAVGKRTLCVRLGRAAAARLYVGALVVAYATLPLLLVMGLPTRVVAAICLSAPVAGWRIWRMWRGDWRRLERWNRIAFCSIVLLVGVTALELVSFASLSI